MPAIRQHITPEQLAELDDAQKAKLREWWQPQLHDVIFDEAHECKDAIKPYHDLEKIKEVALPLLSIGQCAELLQDKITYFNMTNMFARIDDKQFRWGVMKPKNFDIRADELIDALWQAAKTVL